MTTRPTWILALAAALLGACDGDKPASPDVDSQTHWMEACQGDGDCGSARCVCGVCSLPCEGDAACAPSFGEAAACLSPGSPVFAALCKDSISEGGVCVPACEGDAACAAVGPPLVCQEGACVSASLEVEGGESPSPEVCALPAAPAGAGLLEAAVDSFSPALVEVEGGALVSWVDGQYGGAEVVVARVGEGGEARWAARVSAGPSGAARPAVAAAPAQVVVAWEDLGDPDHRIAVSVRALGDGAAQGEVRSLGEVSQGEVVALASSPQALWDGEGWVIAWRQRQERCCPEVASWIRAARLATDGSPRGEPVDLTPAQGEVGEARLVLAEGGLALAWVREGVRFRRFDRAGAPLGEEVVVSGPGARPGRVAVAWNGAQGAGARYALAWEDERAQADQAQIFVAQVDGAGAVVDAEAAVTDVGKESRHPWLVWGEGQWTLRWADEVAVRQPAGLLQRGLSAQGLAPSESALLVTLNQQSGGLAVSGDALAWSSVGVEGAPAPQRQIFFARAPGEGALEGEARSLTPATRDARAGLSVAAGEDGAVAAWVDERALIASGQRVVFTAPLSREGAPLGAPREVARGDVGALAVASGPDGYALLWVEGEASLRLARASAQGAPEGAPVGVGATAEPARAAGPALAWEPQAGRWALSWWEQAQGEGGRVYFQLATAQGAPQGPAVALSEEGAGEAPRLIAAPWGLAALWREGDGALALARVGVDGAALEAPTRWVPEGAVSGFGLAASGAEVAAAWWSGGELWLRRWTAQGAAGEPRALGLKALGAVENVDVLQVFAVSDGWLIAWREAEATRSVRVPAGEGAVQVGALGEAIPWEALAQSAAGFVGLWVDGGGAPAAGALPLSCP
jgi:hypothetical protein